MSLKTFSCSTIITPRHRWKDGIKIDVKEIVWDGPGGLDKCGAGKKQMATCFDHGN
jgi:hypothetical protein